MKTDFTYCCRYSGEKEARELTRDEALVAIESEFAGKRGAEAVLSAREAEARGWRPATIHALMANGRGTLTVTWKEATMDAATAEKVRLADEKFRQQEAEYERKVVTPEGETVAELRAAFELVANKEYWKLPWTAWVPVMLAGRVQRAVEFFHADLARAGEENGKGEILMRGRGYQAW